MIRRPPRSTHCISSAASVCIRDRLYSAVHVPSRVGSVQGTVPPRLAVREDDSSSGQLVDFMFLFASTQSVTTGRTPGANAPLGLLAAPRTLVSLRRAHLVRVAFVCTAPMQLLRCPSAASADGSGVDSDAADIQSTVMRGVLQVDKGVTWPVSYTHLTLPTICSV